MITITLKNGKARVEGYRVYFDGWQDYQFVCHHSDRDGEVDESRWVVSEKISGKRLTVNNYPSDEEAIAAAKAWLGGNRYYIIPVLDKAISAAARAAE